jgi:hypothetical protein
MLTIKLYYLSMDITDKKRDGGREDRDITEGKGEDEKERERRETNKEGKVEE